MMGMDVPGMARTHTLVSGDPMMGWQTDPENDFGSRVFEFPVNVLGQKQVRTLDGTEPGTRINVELASTDEVVAGKPATLIMTVTNAKDGSMVTHPDALISVRKGNFYFRIAARRGPQKAKVAAAKEMLVIMWYMLTKMEPYRHKIIPEHKKYTKIGYASSSARYSTINS